MMTTIAGYRVMLGRWSPAATTLSVTTLVAACAQGPALMPGEAMVRRSALCITEGRLEAGRQASMEVRSPKMRGYLMRASTDAAELHFTYLGVTDTNVPLESGSPRHQLGLKLRAADPCNLVYVMWRIDAVPALVVSVKTNQGKHSSELCGNGGYQNLMPDFRVELPAVLDGEKHHLRADIREQRLQAFVDGRLVWAGSLGDSAADLRGPIGIRTDNVRIRFQLTAEGISQTGAVPRTPCEIHTEDVD
jgi:hypothetical protein